MNRRKKAISVVVALLIVIPAFELAREEFVYLGATKTLKNAYSLIEPGMKQGQVELLAGTPDSTKERNSEEIWYWDAAEHQGKLWKVLGLSWRKGHGTLVVEFNRDGWVTRKWGGVN